VSGIFGILNLDGRPVAPSWLQAMHERMAYWGPDGSLIWQEGAIGLGYLQLFNTPESHGESLPRQDPASGVVLTAHARIDNRDDLIADAELGIALSSQPQLAITDSELLLRAYLRWGEQCVHHLIGDWAFAAWNPAGRKFFLARDHHGISVIYYHRHSRFIAFASSIKGLLAIPDIPQRPNLFRIAQVLASWPGDGVQTAYEEILRLPAAHALTVTADRVETYRYWNPENGKAVRLDSDGEYVEAFLEIYRKAVRCRLRSDRPVGAMLSSGLDSGSVCALAARELEARGKCLPVFTSIPIYNTAGTISPGRYGDESPFVEANRQFIGNLQVNYIRAETISPLSGMERSLNLHDDPGHAAGNAYWITALLQTAQQQGLGVLLTGQMGNSTISWVGWVENLLPLILKGRWRTFWSKTKGLEPSLWKVVKRHLVRPIALPLRDRIQRYRYLAREPWTEYSAINLKFAQSLDLTRRMYASGHDPFFKSPSDPVQTRLKLIQAGAGIGSSWAENGAGYDLEVRDPTMDKRLMEFCLAIPIEQYRRNGQDRWLIRRAMEGLLPDQVRLNTRRGLQAADLGHRFLATLPEVQTMMARLEQSELAREVLDLPKMNHVLQALQKKVNVTTTDQCVTILARGMMAGMFLLRF
jgi:asparagine synthase (glutamine-hydrolysing)